MAATGWSGEAMVSLDARALRGELAADEIRRVGRL